MNVGDPAQPFVTDLFNSMFGYVEANHPNFKLFLSMDLWALGNAYGTDPDITKYSDLMVSHSILLRPRKPKPCEMCHLKLSTAPF